MTNLLCCSSTKIASFSSCLSFTSDAVPEGCYCSDSEEVAAFESTKFSFESVFFEVLSFKVDHFSEENLSFVHEDAAACAATNPWIRVLVGVSLGFFMSLFLRLIFSSMFFLVVTSVMIIITVASGTLVDSDASIIVILSFTTVDVLDEDFPEPACVFDVNSSLINLSTQMVPPVISLTSV